MRWLVSGEVEDLGLPNSGDGDPVDRLRAPLGSTFRGSCWSSLSSLKAGLMVISGLSKLPRWWSGLRGPGRTVRLSPARDSLSSRSFSCHSRA